MEPKLFRLSTYLGSWPDVLKYINPVPVKSGNRILGWASLSQQGLGEGIVTVGASIVMDYSTPERFTIETESQRMFAVLNGAIVFKDQRRQDWSPLQQKFLLEHGSEVSAIIIHHLSMEATPSYPGQEILGRTILWDLS